MPIPHVRNNLKCSAGNKPCGGRCAPNWYNCDANNLTRANTDIANLATSTQENPGNAVGIQQKKNLFASVLNFIPDLFADLKSTKIGTTKEAEAIDVWNKDSLELKERYNQFQPGDVIAKAFLNKKSGNAVRHYGIFVGIDKKTGEPHVVENSQTEKKDNLDKNKTSITQLVKYRSIYSYEPHLLNSDVRETSWVKVESPILPRPQVVERALASIGRVHNYSLLDSNCEHLARMLANNDFYSTAANLRNNVVNSIIRRLNLSGNTNKIGLTAPKLVAEVDRAIAEKRVKVSRKIARYSRKLLFSRDPNQDKAIREEFQSFAEMSDFFTNQTNQLGKKFSSGGNGLLPLHQVLKNLQTTNLHKIGESGRMVLEQILKYYLILASVNNLSGEVDLEEEEEE